MTVFVYITGILALCAAVATYNFYEESKALKAKADILETANTIRAAIIREESEKTLGWAMLLGGASVLLLLATGLLHLFTRT